MPGGQDGQRVGADLVGHVAVGRDAVGAHHHPVHQAAGDQAAGRGVGDHPVGIPARPSSQAVSRAPWSSGRVSSTHTSASRPRSQAAASTPPAVPRPPVASAPVLQWVARDRPGRPPRARLGHPAVAVALGSRRTLSAAEDSATTRPAELHPAPGGRTRLDPRRAGVVPDALHGRDTEEGAGRPKPRAAPSAPSGAGYLDQPGLVQVLARHLLGRLLVQVDASVQLGHHRVGQALVDLVDDLAQVGTCLLHDVVTHEEHRVVRREHALVVLEEHLVVALHLRVGGEDDRQVGLALGQHLVAQVDGHRRELLELQAVDLLEAQQAVQALAALGSPVERELLRLAVEVGDLLQPVLLGRGLGRAHLVRVGVRRGPEGA